MNILQLFISGNIGGIERLSYEYGTHSSNNNIFVFLWEGGIIADKLESAGLTTIRLNLGKKDIFKSIGALKKLCRDYKIDAIVAQHEAPLLRIYSYLVSRSCHTRLYTYAHSNCEDICQVKKTKFLFLRKAIFRFTFNKSDRVIAISESVKKSLVDMLNIRESHISVIYNGVNVDAFAPLEAKHDLTKMLYVGRLIWEKGVQNTLKALSILPKDLSYSFSIVGKGPYEDEIRGLIDEYKLSDKVKLLGERNDVAELMSDADIFLHAPEWEEGFGITVVEAMASGCMCLCFKAGGISEIIDDGVDGYLVEKGNIREYSDKIKEIIEKIQTGGVDNIKTAAVTKSKSFSIDRYAKAIDALVSGR